MSIKGIESSSAELQKLYASQLSRLSERRASLQSAREAKGQDKRANPFDAIISRRSEKAASYTIRPRLAPLTPAVTPEPASPTPATTPTAPTGSAPAVTPTTLPGGSPSAEVVTGDALEPTIKPQTPTASAPSIPVRTNPIEDVSTLPSISPISVDTGNPREAGLIDADDDIAVVDSEGKAELLGSDDSVDLDAPEVTTGFYGESDLIAVKAAFGARTGDAGYSLAADANADGVVNFADTTFVLSNWGVTRAVSAEPAPSDSPEQDVQRLRNAFGATKGERGFLAQFDFDSNGVLNFKDLTQLLVNKAQAPAAPAQPTPESASTPTTRPLGEEDVQSLKNAFGATKGDRAFLSRLDLDANGVLNFKDLTRLLTQWGEAREG